jgi:hypothetical protein
MPRRLPDLMPDLIAELLEEDVQRNEAAGLIAATYAAQQRTHNNRVLNVLFGTYTPRRSIDPPAWFAQFESAS